MYRNSVTFLSLVCLLIFLFSCSEGKKSGGSGAKKKEKKEEVVIGGDHSLRLMPPTNFMATVKGKNQIVLSWDKDPSADYYSLYYTLYKNYEEIEKEVTSKPEGVVRRKLSYLLGSTIPSSNVTTYTHKELTEKGIYKYGIRACSLKSTCTGFSSQAIGVPRDERFITTWQVGADLAINIPTRSKLTYNYDLDCDGDGVYEHPSVTGDGVCRYAKEGIYTVAIRGPFPAIYFNDKGDKDKIITVENWGAINWKTMEGAFHGASKLKKVEPHDPNLSQVTNMNRMFMGTSSFNSDISKWRVSNVKSCVNILSGSKLDAKNLGLLKDHPRATYSLFGWLNRRFSGGLDKSSACRDTIKELKLPL